MKHISTETLCIDLVGILALIGAVVYWKSGGGK